MDLLGDELDETLLIVTADHSHTMSFSGYPPRGNDIRGISNDLGDDNMTYTTLSYANGAGYYIHNKVNDDGTNITRVDLSTWDNVTDYTFIDTSSGYRFAETHGGDDVAIFARGPMGHLVHTTHDQTHIFNVMTYSACIGPYAEDARCGEFESRTVHNGHWVCYNYGSHF